MFVRLSIMGSRGWRAIASLLRWDEGSIRGVDGTVKVVRFGAASANIATTSTVMGASRMRVIRTRAMYPNGCVTVVANSLDTMGTTISTTIAACRSGYVSDFILNGPRRSVFPTVCKAARIRSMDTLKVLRACSTTSVVRTTSRTTGATVMSLVRLHVTGNVYKGSCVVVAKRISTMRTSVRETGRLMSTGKVCLSSSIVTRPSEEVVSDVLW